MDNNHFKELIESLKDLTPTQKRYLISRTKMSLDDESGMLNPQDLLTREELEALLSSASTTDNK
ncbi:hypothetical protein ABLB37_12790 [Vibrio parahaemolyticus]|uniref:Uncharacterized protein n=1 Tax=Vibrio parahaemolyticus TaxID=670 RepID=A0A072L5M9_VIBPH|nr:MULTISPECIES: hypothetical protein [Vibrio]EFO37006.1 conserved hypothetical protein [Vibrio parahaemolyticus Peru-466]EFO47030.1 hypothetical protein VIPARAQ4037_A0986 [Vibrio parahaemolyticus AQ4037]EFO52302.1 conserved hypothetical protein [Vibrio parahaemolyticus K5030]EJG0764529.1 hypothetical protein [Vibrio parahaemolyticus O5:K30]EJG0871240.1 hypothetical protein [Vibrio parahaemolyticus O3]EJG0899899.1 hypothetical protein [Vibrio parahaemolyticus O3:K56]EJG0948932.1 hypothetical